MWSPDLAVRLAPAAAIACAMVFGLSGCGFQPVYGTPETSYAAQDVTAAIRIAPIKDRVGQRIRNDLIRELTPAGEPYDAPYLMRLEVAVSERNEFVRTDREVDRVSVMVTAKFQVIDVTAENPDPNVPPVVIYADTAFAESSFNRFPSEFANIRARIDAENRAAKEVAVFIRNQVIAAVVAGRSG
jgi:LPS-assembly lipoprotein